MKLKKVLGLVGLMVVLYLGSVMLRSYQWEKAAAEYMKIALQDVANPWSVEKLEGRASWGFREKAKLKPIDIVSLAKNNLGNLVEIEVDPKCNIQQGFDSYSEIKHTYAMCVTTAIFEKTTVVMTVRLQDAGDWKNGDWEIINFVSID